MTLTCCSRKKPKMSSVSANKELIDEYFQKANNLNDSTWILEANMLCSLIRNDPKLIEKTVFLLLEKVKSGDVEQALRSLEVLRLCVSKCHERIFKNKFLNRLSILVAKKYDGEKTPAEVREKIMDYLLLWSTEYPEYSNIKTVYNTLRNEVEHKLTNPNKSPSFTKCTFLDAKTEEKFKKLIQSNSPDDRKRANLLLQDCFDKEAKQAELIKRQKDELDKAKTAITVLNQMIEANNTEESLEELYSYCLKCRPMIQMIPEIVEYKENDIVDEALRINDELNIVIARYESLSKTTATATTADNDNDTEEQNNQDLISNIGNDELDVTTSSPENVNCSGDIDCLKDIFDNPPILQDVLPPVPLEPIQVHQEIKIETNTVSDPEISKASSSNAPGALSFIDKISDELLKENLKTNVRIGTFEKKPVKVSLNELQGKVKGGVLKQDLSPPSSPSSSKLLLQNVQLNVTNQNGSNVQRKNSIQTIDDDSQLLVSSMDETTEFNLENIDMLAVCDGNSRQSTKIDDLLKIMSTSPNEINNESSMMKNDLNEIEDEKLIYNEISNMNDIQNLNEEKLVVSDNKKNLTDILLNFDLLKASKKIPKKEIMNDLQGIRITLSFVEIHPAEDVFVIVICVVNQGEIPINDFHLEAGIPKPCKVRLLPSNATSSSLPAVEPLQLPTVDIKQILLLYNPTMKPVDMTFIVSYNLENDPDTINEPIVAKCIPYF